jgi:hypothetical protein
MKSGGAVRAKFVTAKVRVDRNLAMTLIAEKHPVDPGRIIA